MNKIFRTREETHLLIYSLVISLLYLFFTFYLCDMTTHDFLVSTYSLMLLLAIVSAVELLSTIEINKKRDGGLEYLKECEKKLDEMSDDEFIETFGELYDEYIKDGEDND